MTTCCQEERGLRRASLSLHSVAGDPFRVEGVGGRCPCRTVVYSLYASLPSSLLAVGPKGFPSVRFDGRVAIVIGGLSRSAKQFSAGVVTR